MPDAGPNARGRPIVNLLPLEEGEQVRRCCRCASSTDDKYVFFATSHGTVKKTPLTEFALPLQRGKIAIDLDEDDCSAPAITDGTRDIMLFAAHGKAVRFAEDDVRSMGRTATGVRGMQLAGEGDEVIALIVVERRRHPHRDRTRLRQAHAGRGISAQGPRHARA